MSETGKRILSGGSIALFTIFTLVYYDSFYSILPFILLGSVGILGVIEFFLLVDRGLQGKPSRWPGVVVSAGVVLSYYAELLYRQYGGAVDGLPEYLQLFMRVFHPGGNGVFLVLMMGALFILIHVLITHPLDGSIYAMAVTILGILYVPVLSGHAFLYMVSDQGIFYLVFLTLGTTMTDVGAYFAGKYLGRHNAGLKVSPRKTYEGYFGGFLVANGSLHLLVQFWYAPGYTLPGTVEVTLVGAGISGLSILGDLIESAIKRDAKKKDSASLIPGHGGILDLGDALFVTVPAFYYYLQIRGVFPFL